MRFAIFPITLFFSVFSDQNILHTDCPQSMLSGQLNTYRYRVFVQQVHYTAPSLYGPLMYDAAAFG
jgi:hypothetical protein